MKTEVLTIRLSEEQKLKLETYSYEKGISISKVIRNILDKELKEPEIIYLGDGRYYDESIDKPLLLSHNFTSLIFWLLDKNLNPYADEDDVFYIDLLNVIDRITKSRLFSKELLYELEKVKAELKDYLEYEKFQKWIFPHHEDGFNYDVLREAFHIIKFNSDNNKVINLKN